MDPVKDVIDGDLCELFNQMDVAKQKAIAEEMDRGIPEVQKKIELWRQKTCWYTYFKFATL